MQRERRLSEEKIDLIVGIVTVMIALALFVWLAIGIGRSAGNNNFTGEISAMGETRRGSEQVFTYNPDKEIADGENVCWTVNGETVYEGTYAAGEPITLNYTPTETGTLQIVAKIGKYSQATNIEVLAPRLTIAAPNVTVVYGQALPDMNCNVSGFVAGEDVSDFCYDGHCAPKADKLDVGIYELTFDAECCYRDYETEYVAGTLTVLPKQLEVTNSFRKMYDTTNTIENPVLALDGIVEGDEVSARCDTLYFDNKNAGNDKVIMLANVCLEGEDAHNYVLPDFVYGQITPRALKLTGLTVKSKAYDGTTKAEIDKMGTLNGVLDGDSVAIGNIGVSFENAEVGSQRIVTRGITLIGADKDNYTVVSIDTPNAEISSKATFWDRFLDREPIAQGTSQSDK